MPTEEENVQYLYLVLTAGGTPTIDWSAVTADLAPLKIGAVKKRWSRLKQALEQGKNPGPSAQQLLWLCVKHSSRDKPLDWNLIAEKCNTTPGAASKRYSRMKQAFESGTAVPPASASATNGKSSGAAARSKRKRADAKGKATGKGKDMGSADEETDNDGGNKSLDVKKQDDKPKPKRARTTKKAAAVKKENLIESTQHEINGDGNGNGEDDVLPSEQLISELEAAVQDAQAKYHGGGVSDEGEGDEELDDEEMEEMEVEKTQAHFKVKGWLKSLEGVGVEAF
ncbi:uncharacterized protein EI97DRAFT_480598 [Westerdykella ornata]|uniref:Myb-like DNA-binding domain-containing protein n=1 Tax=Westerdykella ornata TaxID=318751 RepID=A0A6A6JBJ8_WESOR|nr:uncharacterized protein EI97DRAFT_480598 [Westerdykella ornata]KAF2273584.1 hypothetical protein EI97DRAFT_480598 [Westerdykella ornata]